MKRLFSKMMLVALAVAAFTACEDVPEPYDIPGTGDNTPGSAEIEGATGTGTLEDPFNAAAALNYGNNLASGETSPNYMYIKGKVVSVKEEFTTQYGNGTFYISSDGTTTNQFYAYRVNYLGNKKFANGDTQIKVGDDVIVCGKITNFNGTIETAQKEGFLYELNGENRGGAPDSGGGVGEATGDGSLENPFNYAAAIAYAKQVGDAESPKDVYIKGKIAAITEEYTTQYGNGTFTISDDGSEGSTFTVFRALYLGNKKFANGDTQIKKGDDVIVCGKVTNYRGNTPETVQGKAYLYSLNGNTGSGGDTPQPGGEAKGDGTLANPFNATAANAYASALGSGEKSDKDVYIKGKIISIEDKNQFNTQYGNCTFYISDDGTDNGDKFYVFRTLYLGNVKYTSGTLPKAGDEVIICGKVMNYMGNTPETSANESYIYSLNGKTEDSGDTPNPNPNPGEGTGSGTQADPYNSVAANAVATALGEGNTSNDSYYIKGKVVSIALDKNGNEQNYNFGTYGNATFYISDDGTENGQFYVYRALYLGNKKWEEGAGDVLKPGDEVIVCGKLTNYNGTPETKQGEAYLYSLNGKTEGSSSGGDDPNPGGDVGGNTISIDFTAQGYANAQEISVITLSDGTKLTFDAGGNTNGPKYYNTGTAIRMYPKNNFTITASRSIVSVVLNCSENNAEGNITASAGSIAVDGMTVNISSVNNTTTTITNAHTGTGATSQLRIKSMSITYAD